MRANTFKEARISLYAVAILLSVLLIFYLFASMFTTMGLSALRRAEKANTGNQDPCPVIIVDPGHGGEDPGACANGLEEKRLNLEIALLLKQYLENFGYKVVLTRSDDTLLYNVGQEDRKKYYDLRNREEIACGFKNALFVSIHFNKFPLESCSGLQVFFSSNNEQSAVLAKSVQSSVSVLQKDNRRKVKDGNNTIYLLERLTIPAILVECGFLSNNNEAKMLAEYSYKQALAFSLYCGIAEYLEVSFEN